MPKSRLREDHKMFHDNTVQVVEATIAFGMGIDKLNVRRIIHHDGWPQSLEAYYQEAGRAGRDGKLADCILFANLTRAPSLLPNRRSEEQTKYGMTSSCCRAKKLVEYFGEDFSDEKCQVCNVCVNGPPEMQNLIKEADVLMQVIAAHERQSRDRNSSYDDTTSSDIKHPSYMGRLNLRMIVSKIREQLNGFGGKVFFELWKVKDLSEKEILRYVLPIFTGYASTALVATELPQSMILSDGRPAGIIYTCSVSVQINVYNVYVQASRSTYSSS